MHMVSTIDIVANQPSKGAANQDIGWEVLLPQDPGYTHTRCK
jgi:hypothetical protein